MWSRIRRRLAAVANPIMIKEMYQSAHSKVTMAVFWVLLGVSLLIYFVAATAEARSPGEAMYMGIMVTMGLVMLLVVPLTAFVGLYREIRSRTYELLQITAMSARGHVWGRLLAAGVRVLYLCALVAPFAVASVLFGGVDLFDVALPVCHLVLAALGASALAILCASGTVQRRTRLLAVLAFGFLLFFGGISALSIGPTMFVMRSAMVAGGGMGSTAGVATWTVLWGAVMVLLWVALLLAAAANRLTFAPDRSSAGPKVLVLLIVGAMWLQTLVEGILAGGGPGESVMVFQVFACALVGLGCLVWLADERHVPHRHRRWLERRGALLRALYVVVRNGPLSTLLYLFLSLALIALGTVLLWLEHPALSPFTSSEALFYPVPLTATYVVYLSGLAGALTYLLHRRRRTASTRKTIVLMLLVLNIFPLAAVPMVAVTRTWELASPATAFFPLLYIASLAEGVPFETFLMHMILPFSIGAAYYVLMGRRLARERSPAGAGVDAP